MTKFYLKERLTKKEKLEEKESAKEELLAMLKPGQKVYTVLRHVSSSGMSRRIDVVIIEPTDSRLTNTNINQCRPRQISYKVAKACGYRLSDRGELIVGGCGMDMGFAVVYDLGRVLFPDGVPCAGKKACCSNEHSNGSRKYTKHLHKDGDYAFDHQWL